MSEAYIDIKGNITEAAAARIVADLNAFTARCSITLEIDEENLESRVKNKIIFAIRAARKRGNRVIGLAVGVAKVGASTIFHECQLRTANHTAKLTRNGRPIGTIKALQLGLIDEVCYPASQD